MQKRKGLQYAFIAPSDFKALASQKSGALRTSGNMAIRMSQIPNSHHGASAHTHTCNIFNRKGHRECNQGHTCATCFTGHHLALLWWQAFGMLRSHPIRRSHETSPTQNGMNRSGCGNTISSRRFNVSPRICVLPLAPSWPKSKFFATNVEVHRPFGTLPSLGSLTLVRWRVMTLRGLGTEKGNPQNRRHVFFKLQKWKYKSRQSKGAASLASSQAGQQLSHADVSTPSKPPPFVGISGGQNPTPRATRATRKNKKPKNKRSAPKARVRPGAHQGALARRTDEAHHKGQRLNCDRCHSYGALLGKLMGLVFD